MLVFTILADAQTTENTIIEKDSSAKKMIVEASCAECQFGLNGTGCVLAIRIKGNSYLVQGVPPMDSYGDAHAADGMCNMVRKAEVTGSVRGKNFVASSFKLLPAIKKAD